MDEQTQPQATGHHPIPSVLAQEIETLDTQVQRFLNDEISMEEFRRYRQIQGVYGQRQQRRYMIRVRVPHGDISPEQLERLALIGETFADGRAHVTTRQDFQFHFVHPERITEALRLLAEVGLHSREACGNTIRNVTACHLAGVCPREAFDVTPYAEAVSRHFLRNPLSGGLPRKFKVAVSGCPADCAVGAIHDIGIIAATREENGVTRRGFRLLVGGGLGAVPYLAQNYSDFVPEEDLLRVCEAVLRVFNRLGERRNRMHARMKFLVKRLGIDAFREAVQAEAAGIGPDAYRPRLDETLQPAAISPNSAGSELGPEALAWRETNVETQRQPGYAIVHVKLLLGDITPDQLRSVARAASQAGATIRATIQQNIVLSWVPEGMLATVHSALHEAALTKPVNELPNIVSCAGTDKCSLGITASRGISQELATTLANGHDPSLNAIRIKVSGCPNSCGHHHLASIGLHGCALHGPEGRLYPAYQLLIGGGVSEKAARLGQPIAKVPAKKAPAAVGRIIEEYREKRLPDEAFEDFCDRLGIRALRTLVDEFTHLPPIADEPENYVDWGTYKLFSLDERGEGECAAE